MEYVIVGKDLGYLVTRDRCHVDMLGWMADCTLCVFILCVFILVFTTYCI